MIPTVLEYLSTFGSSIFFFFAFARGGFFLGVIVISCCHGFRV